MSLFGTRYRYRIRVRNQSDQIGLSFKYAEADAPSPSTIATTIGAGVTSVKWDAERQVDSTEVDVQLSSPGRGLAEITWALGRPDSVVATTVLGGQLQATARLKFGWPREGIYGVYIKVKDVGGTVWDRTIWVPGNRAPLISVNLPDTVRANLPFTIAPQVDEPDHDRLHYSAVGLPDWLNIDSLTGKISGTPENRDTGRVSGIVVSVSDGRRADRTKSLAFFVKHNPWSLKKKMPFKAEFTSDGNFAPVYQSLVTVALGDSILVIRNTPGSIRQAFFIPSRNEWTPPFDTDLPVEKLFGGTLTMGRPSYSGRIKETSGMSL